MYVDGELVQCMLVCVCVCVDVYVCRMWPRGLQMIPGHVASTVSVCVC